MKNHRSAAPLAALSACLMLVCGSPVFGDDGNGERERLDAQWRALDANGDGVVSLEELHPLQAAAMIYSDLDRDGMISFEEYKAYDRDPGGAGRVPLGGNVELMADIAYAGTDDPRQRLDVYLPKQPTVAGPLPVIAYVHGGAWRMGSKVMARSQVMELVDSGRYAAVSIGYRLAWEASWPAQSHDIRAGIRWIRGNADNYGLDASRICAMGASAGGHLVAHLGTSAGERDAEDTLGDHLDQTSEVQCVINFFGPADLTTDSVAAGDEQPSPVALLLGDTPENQPELAREASPLHRVSGGDAPFLIIHGTKDPLVSYDESVRLTEALENAGVAVIFQSVEGGGHGNFGEASDAVNRRVAAFLERMFYDPSTEVPADILAYDP